MSTEDGGPRFPQELLDHCIDLLAEDLEDYCLVLSRDKWESEASRSARSALLSASCTSTSVCHRTRSHIFRSVGFSDAPYFPEEHVQYDPDLGYIYVDRPEVPLKEEDEKAIKRLLDRISTLLEIITWKPLNPDARSWGITHGVAPYIETFGVLETCNFGVPMFFILTEKLAPIMDLLQIPEVRLKELIIHVTMDSYLGYFHPSFLTACYKIISAPHSVTLRLRGLADAPPMLAHGYGIKVLTLDYCGVDFEDEDAVDRESTDIGEQLPFLDHLIVLDITSVYLRTLLASSFSHLRRLSLCMTSSFYCRRTPDIIRHTPLLEHLDLGWRSVFPPVYHADHLLFDLSTLHKLKHLTLCHRDWPVSQRKLDSLDSVLEQLTEAIRSNPPPPSLESMDIVICLPRTTTQNILEEEFGDELVLGSMACNQWTSLEHALMTTSPYCTAAMNFIIHVLPRPNRKKRGAFRGRVCDEVAEAMPMLASGRELKKFEVTVLFGGEETETWSPVWAMGRSFDSGFLR